MEGNSQRNYIIVGDVGGTNCRLQLLKLKGKDQQPELVYLLNNSTQACKVFSDNILQLIKESQIDISLIQCAVLGMAGPVFNGSIERQSNIQHWCPIREKDIEQATGLPKVKLLNDFVANGFGMIALSDEECYSIYSPPGGKLEDNVRLVVGVGTGLGVCQLARPDADQNFHVYSSEAGIIKVFTYTEIERKFEDYVRKQKQQSDRDDIQMVLSGQGLKNIFEFLAKESGKQYDSQLLKEKEGIFENIQSREITQYAREHNDQLCLDALEFFIYYLARYLTDLAFVFLPFGGIYLTSTVIQKNLFMFDKQEVRQKFLELFWNRMGMESYLKKMPITIVKTEELAQRGCLTYAIQNGIFKF